MRVMFSLSPELSIRSFLSTKLPQEADYRKVLLRKDSHSLFQTLRAEAINIFDKGLGEFVYDRYHPKKDQDKKLLEYLSQVRGETEEDTIDALKDAGVFSSRFIQEWERKRRRKV